MRQEQIDRLIIVDPRTDCWIWTGSINDKGYGRLYVSETKRHESIHRYMYERYVGPIPKGYDLDHLCRTTRCGNYKHLEPVTRQENLRRGIGGLLVSAKADRNIHCKCGTLYKETRQGPNGKWRQRYCPTCRKKRLDLRKAEKIAKMENI